MNHGLMEADTELECLMNQRILGETAKYEAYILYVLRRVSLNCIAIVTNLRETARYYYLSDTFELTNMTPLLCLGHKSLRHIYLLN